MMVKFGSQKHVDNQLAFAWDLGMEKMLPIFFKKPIATACLLGVPNLIQLYPREYRVPGVVFWATLCCSSAPILPD